MKRQGISDQGFRRLAQTEDSLRTLDDGLTKALDLVVNAGNILSSISSLLDPEIEQLIDENLDGLVEALDEAIARVF